MLKEKIKTAFTDLWVFLAIFLCFLILATLPEQIIHFVNMFRNAILPEDMVHMSGEEVLRVLIESFTLLVLIITIYADKVSARNDRKLQQEERAKEREENIALESERERRHQELLLQIANISKESDKRLEQMFERFLDAKDKGFYRGSRRYRKK